MARLNRIKEDNVIPFKRKVSKIEIFAIINTVLILGLYLIVLLG